MFSGNTAAQAAASAARSIAVASENAPSVSAYPFSPSGFGTKFADPATLPAGQGNGVAFSADGAAVAVARNASPYITAYPWSGSGFGVKFSNPATLPGINGYGVAFGVV